MATTERPPTPVLDSGGDAERAASTPTAWTPTSRSAWSRRCATAGCSAACSLASSAARSFRAACQAGHRDAWSRPTAGIAVFDRPELHKGGMSFGQDFPRVLNELGVGRCQRMFEYCAGPGYIGYSLLAAGWCETLALADVSRDAVAAARRTAAFNRLDERVAVYESDALDQIPADERWDLVVSNPPHFLPDAAGHRGHPGVRQGLGRPRSLLRVRQAAHGAGRARGHGRERGGLGPAPLRADDHAPAAGCP